MTTLTDDIIKKIIRRLINGQDYRVEVVSLINAEFLQFAVDFFRQAVNAKLKNKAVTTDWYKKEFLNPNMSSDELIIHSGLNKKTISNMYNSARREIVLEATAEHYDRLYESIQSLVEQGSDIDLTLTIKLRGVSVDLNISESLIVINTLAVKRAELRGGAWSSAGKQVEKVLMRTLCGLYNVPEKNYELTGLSKEQREIDFYLIDENKKRYLCEVKLMGKGNPEGADVTIARDSDVFVADKLSDLNKKQLTQRGVKWVELRSVNGYAKFETILQEFSIPYAPFAGSLNQNLEKALTKFF
ncbi:MAG: CfrBI family restriction endonuclease [Anaerolineales bacterium]|nr:CfrBI family restriction endonuclease [Anaerolineales bacterium]